MYVYMWLFGLQIIGEVIFVFFMFGLDCVGDMGFKYVCWLYVIIFWQ